MAGNNVVLYCMRGHGRWSPGLEPCFGLFKLQQALLNSDPALFFKSLLFLIRSSLLLLVITIASTWIISSNIYGEGFMMFQLISFHAIEKCFTLIEPFTFGLHIRFMLSSHLHFGDFPNSLFQSSHSKNKFLFHSN